MPIEILLTRGQVTIVDDEDADLADFKWQAHYSSKSKKFYVQRSRWNGQKQVHEALHRVILSRMLGRKLERKEEVDHENLNPLDNQRNNLRLATRSQNQHNRVKYSNNTSGYKGVSFDKESSKWRVNIQINGKQMFLGRFQNIEDAVEARKQASLKYHKDFARWDDDDTTT